MKKEVAIRGSAEEYLACRFCRRAAEEWIYWDSVISKRWRKSICRCRQRKFF